MVPADHRPAFHIGFSINLRFADWFLDHRHPSSKTGAGNSKEPESMMTGTPSSRSCAIKPRNLRPGGGNRRALRGADARSSVSWLLPLSLQARLPARPRAQGVVSGRLPHFVNPQPEEFPTPGDHHPTLQPQVARNCWKKTSRLTPPAVAGQRTLSIACRQSVIASRRRARYLRS